MPLVQPWKLCVQAPWASVAYILLAWCAGLVDTSNQQGSSLQPTSDCSKKLCTGNNSWLSCSSSSSVGFFFDTGDATVLPSNRMLVRGWRSWLCVDGWWTIHGGPGDNTSDSQRHSLDWWRQLRVLRQDNWLSSDSFQQRSPLCLQSVFLLHISDCRCHCFAKYVWSMSLVLLSSVATTSTYFVHDSSLFAWRSLKTTCKKTKTCVLWK